MPKEVNPDQGTKQPDLELVVTRVFDAPRELVFEAFTDPERLMKWWGPHGCRVTSCEADPRAGGTWSISMRSPRVLPQFVHRHPISQERRSGREFAAHENDWIIERQRGVYQEVVKPERLVFTYAFVDESGRPLHQTVVTVSFADEGGGTRLTVHQAIFESVAARDDHIRGWSEALEHLAEYLIPPT